MFSNIYFEFLFNINKIGSYHSESSIPAPPILLQWSLPFLSPAITPLLIFPISFAFPWLLVPSHPLLTQSVLPSPKTAQFLHWSSYLSFLPFGKFSFLLDLYVDCIYHSKLLKESTHVNDAILVELFSNLTMSASVATEGKLKVFPKLRFIWFC